MTPGEARAALNALGPRTREAAVLAGEALTDKQIASRMGVEPEAVKSRLKAARKGLGARNRVALARVVWLALGDSHD